MAYLCLALQARGVSKVVSSSGGNAGLACATAAGRLGMSVEVVVPDTTKPMVVARLRSLGAAVTVHARASSKKVLLLGEFTQNGCA